MKITILGNAPGSPQSDANQAAVLVEIDKGMYLLDCGEGISQQLLKLRIPPEAIDRIIITHFHPDHIAGIFLLLQMWILENRKKKLTIFLPENILGFEATLNLFYLFPERFPFQLILKECKNLYETEGDMEVIENDHLAGYRGFLEQKGHKNCMRSYSVKFADQGKSCLYTSDLADTSFLKKHLAGADLLIIDACHISGSEINELTEDFPGRIILNHASIQKMKKIRDTFPGSRFDIAHELEEIIL